MIKPPYVLLVREVAERLHISRSAVYRRIAAGEIPAKRIGRALRIPTEALRTYAKARTHA